MYSENLDGGKIETKGDSFNSSEANAFIRLLFFDDNLTV